MMPSEIDAVQAQVLSDVAALSKQLAQASVDPESEWFRNLLLGILNCSLTDYASVQNDVRRTMHLAALGMRNLMDLRVITDYVLASRKNALEFKNSLAHDASQFYDGLSKLQVIVYDQLGTSLTEEAKKEGPMQAAWEQALAQHLARGPQDQHLASEAHGHQQRLKELGLETAHFKRTKEMASDQGTVVKEELDAVNTICSKLLHRTALSIASATTKDALEELGPLLRNCSFSDVLLVYDAIKRHVQDYGIQPPG
jgi:hypothetical protein